MDREEALQHFYSNYVIGKGFEQVEKLYTYCMKNKKQLCKQIFEGIELLSRKIQEKQQKGEKGEIFSIGIFVLRSEIYTRNGGVRIYGFDEGFYLDNSPVWIAYDAKELFQFLWEFEDYLTKNSKQYVGKILQDDIRHIILQEYTPYFIQYIIEISRLSVQLNGTKIFDEINKKKDFCIVAGEYKGKFDEIYLSETIDYDNEKMRDLMNIYKENEDEFFCKNYQNINLDQLNLQGINFTKSVFHSLSFCYSNLNQAYLIKTRFINCNLSNTTFKGALLFDADFYESDLSNCNFAGAAAPVTRPHILHLDLLSFIGASFQKTNLKNTKFIDANFCGADFRGAIFENTDFEETKLKGAIFNRQAVERLELSTEQLEEIILTED